MFIEIMKNELPIGTVINFKTYDGSTGNATIIGYDIFHSKYHAKKHHSWDDKPMESVMIWLFENEIISVRQPQQNST